MTEPLVVAWQAGDAAADIRAVAPSWQRRTGTPVAIRELDWNELYAQPLESPEAFDVVRIAPSWLPDMIENAIVAPHATAQTERELLDYHPLYRSIGVQEGVRYGYFDDGDCLIFYSRQEYLDAVGRAPPATWPEFLSTAAEISDAFAPAVYGAAPWTATFGHFVFMGRLRANGGQFFDPDTMRADIDSETARAIVHEMTGFGRGAFPGSASWSPGDVVGPWLHRRVGMTYWWPPLARWSGRHVTHTAAATDDTLVTPFPDPAAEVAGGAVICLTKRGARRPEAVAFVEWLISAEVSLKRTLVDSARTDPYRMSHFESPVARAAFEGAAAQLDCCRSAADRGLIDLAVPAALEYMRELQVALDRVGAGAPVEEALGYCAAAWDAITGRIGVDKMRRAYLSFSEQRGAMVSRALSGSVPHSSGRK
jgi:multiple sugar transport system substrate-binding protein